MRGLAFGSPLGLRKGLGTGARGSRYPEGRAKKTVDFLPESETEDPELA
jgi:hypothetical protein